MYSHYCYQKKKRRKKNLEHNKMLLENPHIYNFYKWLIHIVCMCINSKFNKKEEKCCFFFFVCFLRSFKKGLFNFFLFKF